jgi:hypothetical protein
MRCAAPTQLLAALVLLTFIRRYITVLTKNTEMLVNILTGFPRVIYVLMCLFICGLFKVLSVVVAAAVAVVFNE